MFLRTFLTILGAAALSAPALAGGDVCDKSIAAVAYQPAAKLAASLAGKQAAYGLQHPDTIAASNALAAMYKGMHRYLDAEALYLRSLAALESTLGRGHSLTVGTMKSLAALYEAQGRQEEAALLYRRAGPAEPSQLAY